MAIELKMKEQDFDNRKQYLVALAIAFLEENTGYSGLEDTLNYDETTCDGYCLAQDLKDEFNLEDVVYITNAKEIE